MVAPVVAVGAKTTKDNPKTTIVTLGLIGVVGYVLLNKVKDALPSTDELKEIAGDVWDEIEDLPSDILDTGQTIVNELDDLSDTIIDDLPIPESSKPSAKLTFTAIFNPLSFYQDVQLSSLSKPSQSLMNSTRNTMESLNRAIEHLLRTNNHREAERKKWEYQQARSKYNQARDLYDRQMSEYQTEYNRRTQMEYERSQSNTQFDGYSSRLAELAVDGIEESEAPETITILNDMLNLSRSSKYIDINETKTQSQISDITNMFNLL